MNIPPRHTPHALAAAMRWRRSAFALAGAGVLALTLAACGGPEAGAQNAAEQWMDALNDGNLDKAKALSTDSTRALLEMGSAVGSAMGEGAAGQSMGPGKYEITQVEMTGENTARVSVKTQKGESNTLDLVRVDGDWKVGVNK
jgi:hypothetical protein